MGMPAPFMLKNIKFYVNVSACKNPQKNGTGRSGHIRSCEPKILTRPAE